MRARCRRCARLLAEPAVVAIGECGLDYFRNFSRTRIQERAFHAQLALAVELAAPVFLHQRDAHSRFIAILREHRARIRSGVAHCFTGTAAELDDYLALDLHIGITGWICDERRGGAPARARATHSRRAADARDGCALSAAARSRADGRRRGATSRCTSRTCSASSPQCRDEDPQALAAATSATARAFFGLDRSAGPRRRVTSSDQCAADADPR